MATYGRTVATPQMGVPVTVLYNQDDFEAKPGGVTIDWATVAAPGADVTLIGGQIIPSGTKYLRYGQVVSQISATGYYGPYDPAANDGRQRIDRTNSYIVNDTVMATGFGGFTLMATDHPGVFNGGIVWKARLLVSSGAHSLASGPTVAEFEAAFPDIKYASTNL